MKKKTRTIKPHFILVANIKTSFVELVVEGFFTGKTKGESKKFSELLIEKANQLTTEYPPDTYDTVIGLGTFKQLKKAFPEFDGWEKAKREHLLQAEGKS